MRAVADLRIVILIYGSAKLLKFIVAAKELGGYVDMSIRCVRTHNC